MLARRSFASRACRLGGDSEPYDLESTVTATVKLDEKGKMKLDASGKPEFEIKFS